MDVFLPPSPKLSHLIQGDVRIHPTVVIGVGAILMASPGSRLTLAEGVCVGRGAVLQAYEGTLELEAGASLGAGVVIIGQGTIGANACIGASTTIFNASVASEQIVPANSLLGDTSRRIQAEEKIVPAESKTIDPDELSHSALESQAIEEYEFQNPFVIATPLPDGTNAEAEATANPSNSEPETSAPTEAEPAEELVAGALTATNAQAHGQQYVNQLIGKLLPGRRLI